MKALILLPSLAVLHASPPLDEARFIGSHNSYHLAPPAEIMETIVRFNDEARQWDYSHPTLTEQLDLGIRQFELDLYADPDGGLFARPLALKLAALGRKQLPPFDPDGHLAKPGFKILHVPDIDCWSHVPTLDLALDELLAWSQAHPDHLPVMLLLECKDQPHPPLPTRPVAFDRDQLLKLEEAIVAKLSAKRLFTPDQLRGKHPTLPAAIKADGWPAIDDLRGRFLLCLDNTGSHRNAYLEGNPALEGRLFFVSAPASDHPAAAWFKINDPVRHFDRIRQLVDAGFLVRTRADAGKADPERRKKALESGAQWISTDLFNAAGEARVRFENDALHLP